MKTKEEILDTTHWDFVVENGISCISTRKFPEAYKQQALISMGKYAKQQAGLFGEFVTHNDWVYLPSKKLWYNEEDEENITPKTTEELYNLFLQSQNKKAE